MKGKLEKCRETKNFLKLDFDSINPRKKNSNSLREKKHEELTHTIGKLGNAAMSNTLGICTEIKGRHKFENDGEIIYNREAVLFASEFIYNLVAIPTTAR